MSVPARAPRHGGRDVAGDDAVELARGERRRCRCSSMAAKVERQRKAPGEIAEPFAEPVRHLAEQEIMRREAGRGAVAAQLEPPAIEGGLEPVHPRIMAVPARGSRRQG